MKPPSKTAVVIFFLAVSRPAVPAAFGGVDAAFRAILENQAVIGIQGGRILENQKEISALLRGFAERRESAVALLEREGESLALLRKEETSLFRSLRPVGEVDATKDTSDLETDEIGSGEETPDTEGADSAAKEAEESASELESDFVAEAAEEESVIIDLVENLGDDFDGDGVPDDLEDLAGTSMFEESDVPTADGLQTAVEEFDLDDLVQESDEAEDLYEDEIAEIEDDLESEYDDADIDVEEYL